MNNIQPSLEQQQVRQEKKKGGLLLKVFLGIEINFKPSLNDFLIYGLDEEFLLDNPWLDRMPPRQLFRMIHEAGFTVFQAHPMRDCMTHEYLKNIDGVEVFNGNTGHDSRNNKAFELAEQNNLAMIAGSDCHRAIEAGSGGTWLAQEPRNGKDLTRLIKNSGPENLYQASDQK